MSPAAFHYLERGVYLSLYLALFNLIPMPPLDGSKLLDVRERVLRRRNEAAHQRASFLSSLRLRPALARPEVGCQPRA